MSRPPRETVAAPPSRRPGPGRLPTACYRLQFRNGMDFDAAAALVPYLAGLGVSHLYASPIFTAQRGSTHGYDITDPCAVEPDLGGRDGLMRLSATLKREGLGLILDIVPNHLAFSVETPWLRDVLRRGAQSRFHNHFAFDAGDERLRLPWLAAPFETVLADSAIAVGDDPDGPVLVAGGLRVPLARTPSLDLARGGDAGALRALHAEQSWRLVHWRTEGDALSHRRFFNITGLIGVRVEDEAVFEAAHRLVFDLVDAGVVDGLRIDHVDGLLDPETYLTRLAARLPGVPVWVEKILSPGEFLPRSWAVEGTTGYVAARAFSRLLTDAGGLAAVDDRYRAATGRTDPLDDVVFRARQQIMTHDLAAELWLLHRDFARLAAADPVGVEFGPEALREALLSLICVFSRYRTYMTDDRVTPEDAALVHRAAAAAAARLTDPGAVPFLAEVLTRPEPDTASFRLRFQQVTGAAVAKSVEDTTFFREVRLLSANEVGSHPDDEPLGIEGFHRAMERRAALMPHGLTLTSSHDTKRSEDARMRIVAISHAPEAFAAWHRICRGFAPEALNPNVVWYVAQTFLALDHSDGDVADRLAGHVVKALREAKSETFWTAPDLELEEAAQAYVRRLAAHFPAHAQEVRPILVIADRLSLIQTALKLTVPGIPDIYQGCEFASYALTDPDNRRPLNIEARAAAVMAAGEDTRPLDRLKYDMTRRLLGLRRRLPGLFLGSRYVRRAAPPGLGAFDRTDGAEALHVGLALGGDPAGLVDALPAGEVVWPPPEADVGMPVRIVLSQAS